MATIESTISPSGAAFKANRDGMLALIARMRAWPPFHQLGMISASRSAASSQVK